MRSKIGLFVLAVFFGISLGTRVMAEEPVSAGTSATPTKTEQIEKTEKKHHKKKSVSTKKKHKKHKAEAEAQAPADTTAKS